MPKEVAEALKAQGEWRGEGRRERPASFETLAARAPQDDELSSRHGEERPEPVEGRVSNHAAGLRLTPAKPNS
jgi:hypothetical protein